MQETWVPSLGREDPLDTPAACSFPGENARSWGALGEARPGQSSLSAMGLVHWDDPEGWYGKGGGRGVQDGEHVHSLYTDTRSLPPLARVSAEDSGLPFPGSQTTGPFSFFSHQSVPDS